VGEPGALRAPGLGKSHVSSKTGVRNFYFRPGLNRVQGQRVFQPGNPQQNAYVARFNRTVRYEWLAQYLFESIGEVQEFATRWLWKYNHERPNMALGGLTPKQRLAMAA
jgi:hypothetical protein